MVDKIIKVSDNFVTIYFIDKPALTIVTEDGTALRKALDIQIEETREFLKKSEKTNA